MLAIGNILSWAAGRVRCSVKAWRLWPGGGRGQPLHSADGEKIYSVPGSWDKEKSNQNRVQALVPFSLLHACDTYMWQLWIEWNIIMLSILFQSHYCTVTQSFVGSIHTVMNTSHVYTLYKPRPKQKFCIMHYSASNVVMYPKYVMK